MKYLYLIMLAVHMGKPSFCDEKKLKVETVSEPSRISFMTPEIPASMLPVSMLIENIERDMPFVVSRPDLEKHEVPFSDTAHLSLPEITDTYRRWNNKFEVLFKKELTQLPNLSNAKTPVPEKQAPPAEVKETFVESLNQNLVSQLLKCAKNTVPYLRHYQRQVRLPNEVQPNNAAEITPLFKNVLMFTLPERAKGTTVTPDGIVCGKYLGEYGVKKLSPYQEAKFLTAVLSSYPKSPSVELFAVLLLASQSERKMPLRSPAVFWEKSLEYAVHSQILYGRVTSHVQDWVYAFRKEVFIYNSNHSNLIKLNVVEASFELSATQDFMDAMKYVQHSLAK